ncbi:MAG: IS4 family transposase [Methanobacteriota archaeon]
MPVAVVSKTSKETRFFLNRLDRIFPAEWLEQQARETGLVKRLRSFNPVLLFWILVLQAGVHLQNSLEALRRGYNAQADEPLAHSSFYERFTPELVKFLYRCVLHALEELSKLAARPLAERLRRFKDVLIQDSTIIRLHAKLAKKWPATRARKVAAGVKLATLVSVVADGPTRVRLHGERTSEVHTLRLGPWVKDRLLLLDLGFFKYQVFDRITRNKGFFVSRPKDNADPFVTRLIRTVRGNSLPVEGERLRDVLPRLKRGVLDVEVEVSFRRRAYGGSTSGATRTLRVVAVLNDGTGEYHVYVTNRSPDEFSAEDVAALYGARWEIELLFRELKGTFRIDVIPTANARAVEALLWTGILAFVIHRLLYVTKCELFPEQAPFLSHERSARAYREQGAMILFHHILAKQGLHADFTDVMEYDTCGAFNPYRKTGAHMEGIRA